MHLCIGTDGARTGDPTSTTHMSPIRILTELEHRRVQHLTVPTDLLAVLAEHPAADMTDLSALERITCVGEEPSPDRVRSVESVFDAVVVHSPDHSTGPVVAATDLADTADRAGDAAADVTREHVEEYRNALNRAATLSILAALQSRGVLVDPARSWSLDEVVGATSVAVDRRDVVRRWLRVLVSTANISEDAGRYRGADPVHQSEVTDAWATARQSWCDGLGAVEFIDYLASAAIRLDRQADGSEAPVTLLFPEGDTRIADAVYGDTVTARYLNEAVAAAAADVCEGSDRRVRVVELGAGTGATTRAIAHRLGVDANVDYLFTDVSRFFLDKAVGDFDEYAWMRYGLADIDDLDIGRDVDVVVAAGVLNNARDLPATIDRIARSLTRGGVLLATEPVGESLEILVSQALMMTPPTDFRAVDGTTFAAQRRWTDQLTAAGFEVAVTPAEDHVLASLGQRLFVGVRS